MNPPTNCQRCDAPLTSYTMSWFNVDIICIPCQDDEKEAPGFAEAKAKEEAEVAAGNTRFEGVGLSDEAARFLAERRAARLAGAR